MTASKFAGVAATVCSAGFSNVGKALQKKGTQSLPRLTADAKVLRQYLTHRTWLLGLLLDIGGGALAVVALAQAPVTVVQPISSSGLAILALFSHFYLDERLSRREWLSVALAGAGVVGVAAAAEEAPTQPQLRWSGLLLLLLLLGLAASAMAAATRAARRSRRAAAAAAAASHSPRQAHAGSRADELLSGTLAGVAYALSASACRAGMVLSAAAAARGGGAAARSLPAAAGLGASLGLTAAGVLAQTRGLKDGSAMVVCTAAAVSSMVAGLAAGLLVLGERMPAARGRAAAALLSWTAIAGGVWGLSGGANGKGERGGGLPVFHHRPSKSAEAAL